MSPEVVEAGELARARTRRRMISGRCSRRGSKMTVQEVLREWDAAMTNVEAARKGNRPVEEDRLWNQMTTLTEKLWDVNVSEMSQDDVVQFLDLAQRSSWDIPSALMTLCGHLDEDEYFWMHRPAWQIREEDGKRVVHEEKTNEMWDPADKHFEEEHGWNLKDDRIDWSFDT